MPTVPGLASVEPLDHPARDDRCRRAPRRTPTTGACATTWNCAQHEQDHERERADARTRASTPARVAVTRPQRSRSQQSPRCVHRKLHRRGAQTRLTARHADMDRSGRIRAVGASPGRGCRPAARLLPQPRSAAADRADVRPESDVRQFARSALEGADVGFVVVPCRSPTTARSTGRCSTRTPFIHERWMPRRGHAHRQPHVDARRRGQPRRDRARSSRPRSTSGERFETDHEIRLPSGATAWRRVIAIPLDDDVVAMMTYDIGELVDARSRARRVVAAQLRHRRASASLEDGLSWVSPAVEAMLGYRRRGPRRAVRGRPRAPRRRRRRSSSASSTVVRRPVGDPDRRAPAAARRRRVPVVPVLDREPDRRSRGARHRDEHARHRRPPALRGRAAHLRAAHAQHPRDRGRRDHHERRDRDDPRVQPGRGTHLQARRRADVIGTLVHRSAARPRPTTSMWVRKALGAVRTGVPMEIVTARSDGEEFEARISISRTTIDGRTLTTAIVRDVSKEKEAARALEQRGLYDELTGLATRKLLIDRLDEAIRRAKRRRTVVGVLLLDLDRFKHVNDSLGHDSATRCSSRSPSGCAPAAGEANTVARLGGDEFVVLCDEARDIDDISDRAGRLDEVLRSPFVLGDEEVMLTASIGIAVWNGGDERGRRARPPRRRRDVPGQGPRSRSHRAVRRAHADVRVGPPRPRVGAAPRDRPRRARRVLPADRRVRVGATDAPRSARAVEAPRRAARSARRVHRHRRGDRPHPSRSASGCCSVPRTTARAGRTSRPVSASR